MSLSSSAVPHCRARVSFLFKLIAAQSVDTSLWLRAEMVRLVDPIIDSLLLRLIMSHSVRPAAQPFKQTHLRSTVSELCQLMEQEKQETNRLLRGQMDQIVNSLFLRLTNKLLVNTQIRELVQPSPSNHQNDPSNASIAPSTLNNPNEHLSTDQIVSSSVPLTNYITTSSVIKLEYLQDSSTTIPINIDCKDAPNDDVDNDAETGVDTQIQADGGGVKRETEQSDQCDEFDHVPFGKHLSSPLGSVQSVNDNEREEDQFDEVDVTDEDEEGDENGDEQAGGDGELLTSGQIDEDEIDVNDGEDGDIHMRESESNDDELTENEQMDDGEVDDVRNDEDTVVEEESDQNGDEADAEHEMDAIVHRQVSKRCKRTGVQQDEMDVTNAIGEESRPNLVQPNSNLQCPHCHKSWVRKSMLQRHLRVHTGERPFKCDQCHKGFSQSGDLTKHQLIHQNIKRFRCQECDKQFTQKPSLDSHLLLHSGQRPFECRYCEKSFPRSFTRNYHEQAIHLHVKPYRCKQCGHSSTQRSHIITHIRMVHFGLPKSIKQQRALNIIDDRDPRELVEKVKSDKRKSKTQSRKAVKK